MTAHRPVNIILAPGLLPSPISAQHFTDSLHDHYRHHQGTTLRTMTILPDLPGPWYLPTQPVVFVVPGGCVSALWVPGRWESESWSRHHPPWLITLLFPPSSLFSPWSTSGGPITRTQLYTTAWFWRWGTVYMYVDAWCCFPAKTINPLVYTYTQLSGYAVKWPFHVTAVLPMLP
ncbi:hypothetical protein B0T19DRAFT_93215 [Cercophora scortea]|uniref:Uncharacterized protein n=1 Tax=Cercophora scortea TaxID=314031 RepID=A0AAE0MGT2_9PEZI|nr:hypothetical protein B0T19DRAFT_93215 [Cercophora scortea]